MKLFANEENMLYHVWKIPPCLEGQPVSKLGILKTWNVFIIHWEILKIDDDSTIIPLPFPPRLSVILCVSITAILSGGKVATVKI